MPPASAAPGGRPRDARAKGCQSSASASTRLTDQPPSTFRHSGGPGISTPTATGERERGDANGGIRPDYPPAVDHPVIHARWDFPDSPVLGLKAPATNPQPLA